MRSRVDTRLISSNHAFKFQVGSLDVKSLSIFERGESVC